MDFVIKANPIGYDVPIANIMYKSVRSDDVVQIVDFSHMLSGNHVGVAKNVDSSPYGEDGIPEEKEFSLIAKSSFESLLLTNEYHYDRSTSIVTPLWYIHYPSTVYHNKSMVSKSIRKTIRSGYESTDRIIPSIIPVTGSYIIIRDSVSIVRKRGVVESTLDPWLYHVDYAKGNVLILRSEVEADDIFTISYDLLTDDVKVTTEDGLPYRVEVAKAFQSNSPYYILYILTNSQLPVSIKYRKAVSDHIIDEVEEVSTPTEIFSQVDTLSREAIVSEIRTEGSVDIASRRIYSLEEGEDGTDIISVTTDNSDVTYTFTSSRNYDTRIRITSPKAKGFSSMWYPEISHGRVYTTDGRVFTIGSIESPYVIKQLQEIARVVNSNKISVSSSNIAVMYTGGRSAWYGIDVEKQGGIKLTVEAIDTKNGTITLAENVSVRDTITVRYRVRSETIPVTSVCVNPLSSSEYCNKNIRENVLLYMIGENKYDTVDIPVYIKTLPKYVGGKAVIYTYDDIDEILNSDIKETRNEYRLDIDSLPSVYSGDDLIRLEPLAILYVTNPLDEDGIRFEDARIYGGGMAPYHRHYYDHSYYDGEGTDMNTQIVVKIPVAMYNDLIARALEWDPDVIIADNPQKKAHEKTMNLIRNKVKKFSQLGTVQEITIE